MENNENLILSGIKDGLTRRMGFVMVGVIPFAFFSLGIFFLNYIETLKDMLLMGSIFSCFTWINPVIFKDEKEKIKFLSKNEKKEYLKGYKFVSVIISFGTYVFLIILLAIVFLLLEKFEIVIYHF